MPHGELDTAIFFMDMRTYGKEFERYYNRAQEESGVRFVRSRIHSIEPAEPGQRDWKSPMPMKTARCRRKSSTWWCFRLGWKCPTDVQELAARLGVSVDADGFASH